jgi:hypothetical protein
MAALAVDVAIDFVSVAIQIGTVIAGIFNGDKEDKDYRSGWTQQAVGELSADNPGKNIMVIYTDHDASKLNGCEKKVAACKCPNSGASLAYGCYIFDDGPFELKGDGYVLFLGASETTFAKHIQWLPELVFFGQFQERW